MRRAISVLLIAVVAAFAVAGVRWERRLRAPDEGRVQAGVHGAERSSSASLGAAVGKAVNESAGKSNKQLRRRFGDVADRRTREVATSSTTRRRRTTRTIQTQQRRARRRPEASIADDLDAISKAAGKNDLKAAGEGRGQARRATPRRRGKAALDEPSSASRRSTTTKTTKTK